MQARPLRLFEIARVLVRLDHVARCIVADCVDRVTEPVYWGRQFSHEAALLGDEYEDENDDDDHGCGAAVRDR